MQSMNLSRRGLFTGSLALATAATASRADDLDWIGDVMAEHHAPGIAVTIIKGGRTIASIARGRASLGLGVAVTDRTLFHTGSVGKHITVAAALRLVERDQLSLDAPVGDYAPKLPPHLASRPFRSLLDHTSGFPDYSEAIEWDRPFDRDRFHRLMRDYPAEFDAGTAWNYSNAAYVLVGYILEDLAGKDYAHIVGDDLFRPNGLTDSRVDQADIPISGRAEPHSWIDGHYTHATRMSGQVSSVAAGGILMSMRDVAPWVGVLHGGKVISNASLDAMATPVRLSTGRPIPYGLGWMLDRMPDGKSLLYHGGSVPGFRTMHIRIPHRDLSIMAVANADTPAASIIAWRLLEQYAGGTTPLSLSPIADTEPALTAQARSIVTRAEQPLDQALFAPEQALHLAADRDYVIPQLTARQVETMTGFVLVQEDMDADGLRRRRYRAQFPTYARHVDFRHLADGRIYFVRIQ
ncbi:serine hydrolase domain-containing protein [Niveispirillum sp. KHB5.9]|uniref:serine hydrolase domain-containing protein n=1 Tax=Niveispirillum sp. KHB5.9 TaxID=3400269 RepID=UPI003A84838D